MLSSEKICQYIDLRLQGHPSRKAASVCVISRTTGEKYYKLYREKLREQMARQSETPVEELVRNLVEVPCYDSSNRKARKYSQEMDAALDSILNQEDDLISEGIRRLSCAQIHDLLCKRGFAISLSTVATKVREKRKERESK